MQTVARRGRGIRRAACAWLFERTGQSSVGTLLAPYIPNSTLILPPAMVAVRKVAGLALDLAILLSLAWLPFVYFWRLMTRTSADVTSFPVGDITDLHFPYRHFIAGELARGRLPFWDPYVSGGHPVLGDLQHALFYPVGLLVADWAGPTFPMRALAVQMALHFSIAAVFTFLLGRRLLHTRAAAALAAIVFTFGGYLTSFPVQQLGILQTAVWLPAILFFLDLAIAWRSPAVALLAGLAIAMAALAGHPQTLLYVLATATGFALFRAWDDGATPPPAPHFAPTWGHCAWSGARHRAWAGRGTAPAGLRTPPND